MKTLQIVTRRNGCPVAYNASSNSTASSPAPTRATLPAAEAARNVATDDAEYARYVELWDVLIAQHPESIAIAEETTR